MPAVKKPEKGLKRGPVPMSDKGTKTFWIRLPRELADIVEKRARMTNASTSSIIRDMVRAELCR